MKKFEAVSGDQGLFELVGASDDDLFIVKCNKGVFSSENGLNGKNIAERKPVEKYVPKVGDEFKVTWYKYEVEDQGDFPEREFKCHFVDNSGCIWSHDRKNEVFGLVVDWYEFTKIDRSPNPVNMVVSTQIPRVGERFKIDKEMDRTFKCSKISGGYVVTECGCEFAISLNEFNIVAEDKWVPKEGESFRVGGILYHDARFVFEGAIAGDTDVFGYPSTYSHHQSTIFKRP